MKQQALKRAETLLENNQIQVEVGTLAPIEVVRAQAEVARSRQALTNSESLVLQQEVILKNFLSRRGTEDPEIRSARLGAMDRITHPGQGGTPPLDKLVRAGLPEPARFTCRRRSSSRTPGLLSKARRMRCCRSWIWSVRCRTTRLAGEVNPLPLPGTAGCASCAIPIRSSWAATGPLLSQIFRRNYPDYGVFRAAEHSLEQPPGARRHDARRRPDEPGRDAPGAAETPGADRGRGGADRRCSGPGPAYDAARQTRVLQEDALQAEQEKYSVGATTSFFLIQYQRDLAQARSDEVLAESLYAKAQTALERAVGMTLSRHNIEFDDAVKGEMRQPPRPIPPSP